MPHRSWLRRRRIKKRSRIFHFTTNYAMDSLFLEFSIINKYIDIALESEIVVIYKFRRKHRAHRIVDLDS